MKLLDPIDNLRIVVAGSVRVFLFGQGKNNARIILARLSCARCPIGDFNPGPFPPEVESRSCFQHFSDVSTAYARRNLQEIETAVSVALNKLRVSCTLLNSLRL